MGSVTHWLSGCLVRFCRGERCSSGRCNDGNSVDGHQLHAGVELLGIVESCAVGNGGWSEDHDVSVPASLGQAAVGGSLKRSMPRRVCHGGQGDGGGEGYAFTSISHFI